MGCEWGRVGPVCLYLLVARVFPSSLYQLLPHYQPFLADYHLQYYTHLFTLISLSFDTFWLIPVLD